MKKAIKLNLITLGLINTIGMTITQAQAEETLGQIDVVEKVISNDKKPFTEAKAKSTRENVFKETQTIDQVIRSIPGAFTQQDKGSGVVSVNIRGENGLGRVNTMVDGVTQTFYSTALDSGQSGGSSQFGAAIDPNFIAGVDVNKSNFSGASGINALAGSANFRTLSVNDVITDDKPFGIILKGMTGSNATKSNFMTTAAGRKWLDNGGYVGVVYGYSQREVSQDYRIGGGERLASLGQDILAKEKEAYFRNAGYILDSEGQWAPDLNKPHWYCNKQDYPKNKNCGSYRIKSAATTTRQEILKELLEQKKNLRILQSSKQVLMELKKLTNHLNVIKINIVSHLLSQAVCNLVHVAIC